MDDTVFGVNIFKNTSIEIRGFEEGKCVYYQKIIQWTMEYGDTFVQSLSADYTADEIAEMEQSANESAQLSVGEQKLCKFEQNDLISLLNNWKQGSFSSSDYDGCITFFDITTCSIEYIKYVLPYSISSGASSTFIGTNLKERFSDWSNLEFISENESIAKISSSSEGSITFEGVNPGSTTLSIVDNTFGSSCNVSKQVEVG